MVQSDRSLIAAFCGQRRDRPLTVQALSGMGTGEVGPLSWAVCPLLPCSLLTKVGLRPSSATDLLGEAIPCHLWVSVSSAERQIDYYWAASGEKDQEGHVFGIHRRAGVRAPECLLRLGFSTRANYVLRAFG